MAMIEEENDKRLMRATVSCLASMLLTLFLATKLFKNKEKAYGGVIQMHVR